MGAIGEFRDRSGGQIACFGSGGVIPGNDAGVWRHDSSLVPIAEAYYALRGIEQDVRVSPPRGIKVGADRPAAPVPVLQRVQVEAGLLHWLLSQGYSLIRCAGAPAQPFCFNTQVAWRCSRGGLVVQYPKRWGALVTE